MKISLIRVKKGPLLSFLALAMIMVFLVYNVVPTIVASLPTTDENHVSTNQEVVGPNNPVLAVNDSSAVSLNQLKDSDWITPKAKILRLPDQAVKTDLLGDPQPATDYRHTELSAMQVEIESLVQSMDSGILTGNIDPTIATRFNEYLPNYKTLVLERVKSELDVKP